MTKSQGGLVATNQTLVATSQTPVALPPAKHLLPPAKRLLPPLPNTCWHTTRQVNRYAQFLQQKQHHIPKVLMAFLNAVSSSSAKVRSRGCYLFLRVIKTLRSQVQP